MQTDQTVISLRPGGGGGPRDTRFFSARFDSFSFSSDSQPLRPHAGLTPSLKTGDLWFEGRERVQYTRDQMLQVKEVADIPEGILKVKQEIEFEFGGDDKTWGHVDGNVSSEVFRKKII